MAITGIKIVTTDTVLGQPIDVNTTSMIIASDTGYLAGGSAMSGRSVADFALLTDPFVQHCIELYFSEPANSGRLLWVGNASTAEEIKSAIRATTVQSFDRRPRQIAFVTALGADARAAFDPSTTQTILTSLATEGIRCVGVIAYIPLSDLGSGELDINTVIDGLEDATALSAPFVGLCLPISGWVQEDQNLEDFAYSDGAVNVISSLANISVGTSIGDGGLAAVTEPFEIPIQDTGSDYHGTIDVRTLSLAQLDKLGEKGYLFTRKRAPRNGLWWNDGATCNDPKNALSTLEAARTICSMADDLQSFFVPYINTRVPVTSTGDIQSTYKQVVLDNARAAVVQKYIDNGDISDARINLVAKDNDMIGTRTWEVTLSILPATTLRWIDGYVFYVKNL